MRRDKLVTAFFAAALAFLLSMGAAGSMATAFFLDGWELRMLAAACAVSAVFCAACFSWKRGWVLALLAAALAGGYLWRLGELSQQFWQLVYRISHIYNQAYHWGVFKLVDTAWDAGTVAQPMAVLGAGLAAAAAWSVCRGQSAAVPVCLSLLPLLLCVVVTDTVPGTPYLYMLLLSQLTLLLASGVRRDDPYQGNRMTFLAAIPTALALGLLFLAMPRETYADPAAGLRERIISWVQTLPGRGMEMLQEADSIRVPAKAPERVDLAALGRRTESRAPVLYATAETGGPLYLRERDYDVYDGRKWQSTPARVEEFGFEGVSLGYVAMETRWERELLCVPYYPRNGLSLIEGKYLNTQFTQKYSFIRLGLPDNWRELAAAGEADKPELPYAAVEELRYLSLPEDTRANAQALLEPLLRDTSATSDKAQAIAAYVRERAVYDKDPGRMPEDARDFALWFLTEGERGYCVHFATAAAVLLRAAGIEARYVSGYMRPVQAGTMEAFTGEHAHAWAEYYEPGLDAWVVLEATPADGLSGVPEETAGTETIRPTMEPETAPEPTEAPPSEPETQSQQETFSPAEPETETPQRTAPTWLRTLVKTLISLALFAGAMEGQRRLRTGLRRISRQRGGPNRRALKRWRDTERMAAKLREAPPSQLRALAQKAKFSQHTLTMDELALFDAYLASAEQRLRAKAWYWQLVYRYIFALY